MPCRNIPAPSKAPTCLSLDYDGQARGPTCQDHLVVHVRGSFSASSSKDLNTQCKPGYTASSVYSTPTLWKMACAAPHFNFHIASWSAPCTVVLR